MFSTFHLDIRVPKTEVPLVIIHFRLWFSLTKTRHFGINLRLMIWLGHPNSWRVSGKSLTKTIQLFGYPQQLKNLHMWSIFSVGPRLPETLTWQGKNGGCTKKMGCSWIFYPQIAGSNIASEPWKFTVEEASVELFIKGVGFYIGLSEVFRVLRKARNVIQYGNGWNNEIIWRLVGKIWAKKKWNPGSNRYSSW